MTSRIEIFRTGTHQPTHGEPLTFYSSDLESVARSYAPDHHHAPVVVGHPETDSPAYGWVQRVEAVGDRLFAVCEDIAPKLNESVQKGHYKYVSAAFYPPLSARNPSKTHWYLRHVGLLGATPPAVRGLDPVEFADGSAPDDANPDGTTISDDANREADGALIFTFAASESNVLAAGFQAQDDATPASVPTSPVTSASVPTSPVTSASASTSPVTSASASTSPVTSASVATSPVTSASVATSPVTSASVPSAPVPPLSAMTSSTPAGESPAAAGESLGESPEVAVAQNASTVLDAHAQQGQAGQGDQNTAAPQPHGETAPNLVSDTSQIDQLVDQLVNEGKVLPHHRSALQALVSVPTLREPPDAASRDNAAATIPAVHGFASPHDASNSLPPQTASDHQQHLIALIKRVFDELPAQVQFGTALPSAAFASAVQPAVTFDLPKGSHAHQDRLALHHRATKLSVDNNISYIDAVRALSS
ncbi:MAG: hypothetical protein K0U36_00355 [Alphaproteobacteria bacterium]|nr:hypothetical protein [Alphaproteobacteria bacterium]